MHDLLIEIKKNNMLLLMMEAKIQAQQEIIVEMAEIITQKPPDQIRQEHSTRIVELMRKNKELLDWYHKQTT